MRPDKAARRDEILKFLLAAASQVQNWDGEDPEALGDAEDDAQRGAKLIDRLLRDIDPDTGELRAEPPPRPTFEQWMARVEALVANEMGCSVDDLPDMPTRDHYDAGDSPAQFVAAMVETLEDA